MAFSLRSISYCIMPHYTAISSSSRAHAHTCPFIHFVLDCADCILFIKYILNHKNCGIENFPTFFHPFARVLISVFIYTAFPSLFEMDDSRCCAFYSFSFYGKNRWIQIHCKVEWERCSALACMDMCTWPQFSVCKVFDHLAKLL